MFCVYDPVACYSVVACVLTFLNEGEKWMVVVELSAALFAENSATLFQRSPYFCLC
jgi:hypothetical protein